MEDNPFLKKNKDKEIEEILGEAPLKEKKTKKKFKINKNLIPSRTIIIRGAVVLLLFLVLIYIITLPKTDIQSVCEDAETCTLDVTEINQKFVDSMKKQIINKGYVEINDGNNIIKLSPYTG